MNSLAFNAIENLIILFRLTDREADALRTAAEAVYFQGKIDGIEELNSELTQGKEINEAI